MRVIRRILLCAIIFVFLTPGVNAGYKFIDNSGIKETVAGTGHDVKKTLPDYIGTALGVLTGFIGILFLLLMIYGGFKWMLARGNEQEVDKAKKILTAAIIGLIVVLAAYGITALVGQFYTGVQPAPVVTP